MLNEILGAKCTKLELVPWIGAEVRWWIDAMDVCPTLQTSTLADDDDEEEEEEVEDFEDDDGHPRKLPLKRK